MTPSASAHRPFARLRRVSASAGIALAVIVTTGCGGAIGTDRPLLQETRSAQAGAPSTIAVPAAASRREASEESRTEAGASTAPESSASAPADGVK